MAGKLEGKVAFITGAARGQGRSHAIRLAQEGADIIAVDICAQIGSVGYPMATPEDLAETVKEVEALDRRIVATQADVRDYGALKAALDDGVAQLGKLDIVSANAGIFSFGTLEELVEQLTWVQLNRHTKPVLIADIGGFWRPLLALLAHMRIEGFIREGFEARYLVAEKIEDVLPMLHTAAERRSVEPKPQDSVSPRNM